MRAASLGLLLSGALRLVVGLQLLLFVRLVGDWWWVPYGMLLLGGAAMLSGGLASRGRLPSVCVAAVMGPMLLVLGVLWEGLAVPRGLLSPLSLLATGLALPVGVLCPLAVWPARQIDGARRKLLES